MERKNLKREKLKNNAKTFGERVLGRSGIRSRWQVITTLGCQHRGGGRKRWGRNKGKLCVYCGERASTTADHVLGRGFAWKNIVAISRKFPLAMPSQLEARLRKHGLVPGSGRVNRPSAANQ
jgi:hypothetical protein